MKFKERYGSQTLDLQRFLHKELNGADYELGQLETVQNGHSKLETSFINLIETLVKKEVLSKNDVYMIVYGYVPEDKK